MRMHFGEYKKEKVKWQWWLKKEAGTLKAPSPCRIEMHRHYAKQPMDIDNLYSTAKIPLDAMRECGILAEDNPDHVESLSMKQFKVAKIIHEKTVIIITPVNVTETKDTTKKEVGEEDA